MSYDQMILRPVSEVFVPGVVEAVEPEAGLAEAIYSSVECFAPPIEFARTVVTFETHTSAVAPTTLVTDSISTAADLRARPQRMIVQDAAGNAFAVRAGKAAFVSPFYRDSGGHIEIALESLICYPADPMDSSKLPQSRRPFPVALVVHGNHEAATFNVTPDGNSVTDGVNVFLTGEPTSAAGTINSHLGYRYLQEELDNCYACHADYGMYGTIVTKLSGLRHVYEYHKGFRAMSLEEAMPRIHLRGSLRNQNCMQCHSTRLPGWIDVPDHAGLEEEAPTDRVSCVSPGCHGPAHPFSKGHAP